MTPLSLAEGFDLTDHTGRLVTDRDYRGRFMVVFFGFTHCRVVCPRALGRLNRLLTRLDDAVDGAADAITPLYITVDPSRDTPDVMKAFLESNYPRFIGLTGTPDQIDHAKKLFRVFAHKKADPDDPDGYAVPHSAITYVIGPDGKYCAHFADHLDEDDVFESLKTILTDGNHRHA